MVKIVKPEFFGLNQKKIENESSDKIFVDGKSTLVFSNRKTRFCRIEFRGQVENAGGYLVINEQFPVSINSVTIMPIDTPAGFSLKLAHFFDRIKKSHQLVGFYHVQANYYSASSNADSI